MESWQGKRETADPCGLFIAQLALFVGAKVIVEFGSHVGATTSKLCELNPSAKVVGYESHKGFLKQLRSACPSAEIVQADVLELKDQSVAADFAFIDISRKGSYEKAFTKLVIPVGGIVCAHDTCFDGDCGAKEFPSFLRDNGYHVINFPDYYGLAVGMKR